MPTGIRTQSRIAQSGKWEAIAVLLLSFNTQLNITSIVFLIAMVAPALTNKHTITRPRMISYHFFAMFVCVSTSGNKSKSIRFVFWAFTRICLKINLTFFHAFALFFSTKFSIFPLSYVFFFCCCRCVPWPWTNFFIFFFCFVSVQKLFKRDTNFD